MIPAFFHIHYQIHNLLPSNLLLSFFNFLFFQLSVFSLPIVLVTPLSSYLYKLGTLFTISVLINVTCSLCVFLSESDHLSLTHISSKVIQSILVRMSNRRDKGSIAASPFSSGVSWNAYCYYHWSFGSYRTRNYLELDKCFHINPIPHGICAWTSHWCLDVINLFFFYPCKCQDAFHISSTDSYLATHKHTHTRKQTCVRVDYFAFSS